MIEMMILAMIASVVVKRGAEDLIHSARGGTPPRYAAASARRKTGAAARYWGQLWDDTWGDLSKRHAEKRAKRDIHAPRPDRDPSKMRTVLATAGDDVGRWARATWRHGWDKLDQKQQARRLRPRPGQQTVPGKVVPNRPSRPEDEDRPRPEVQDEDDSPVPVPQDETTDPGQQDDSSVPDNAPDSGPDNQPSSPLASTTTQEGTTVMTAATAEVTSLDSAIVFCDQSTQQYRAEVSSADANAAYCTQVAKSYRAQAVATEATQAAIVAGGVTGPALARFTTAMEKANAAAEEMDKAAALFASAQEKAGGAALDMEAAAGEFRGHLGIQEQYNANPGAGTREFVTAG